MVAVARGAIFKLTKDGIAKTDTFDSAFLAFSALHDVAEWLNYGESSNYNFACEDHRAVVEQRLRDAQ